MSQWKPDEKTNLIISLEEQVLQFKKKLGKTSGNPFETHKRRIQAKISTIQIDRKQLQKKKEKHSEETSAKLEQAKAQLQQLKAQVAQKQATHDTAKQESKSISQQNQGKLNELKQVDFLVGQQLHKKKQLMDQLNRSKIKQSQAKEQQKKMQQQQQRLQTEIERQEKAIQKLEQKKEKLTGKKQEKEQLIKDSQEKSISIRQEFDNKTIQLEQKQSDQKSINNRLTKIKKQLIELHKIDKDNEMERSGYQKHVSQQRDKFSQKKNKTEKLQSWEKHLDKVFAGMVQQLQILQGQSKGRAESSQKDKQNLSFIKQHADTLREQNRLMVLQLQKYSGQDQSMRIMLNRGVRVSALRQRAGIRKMK